MGRNLVWNCVSATSRCPFFCLCELVFVFCKSVLLCIHATVIHILGKSFNIESIVDFVALCMGGSKPGGHFVVKLHVPVIVYITT